MNQPPTGRANRRARREQTRELAKALSKIPQPAPAIKRYGTDLFWALIFWGIHIGWGEIAAGEVLWRVCVGWALWIPCFFFVARVFLRWLTDIRHSKLSGVVVVALLAAALSYWAFLSIREFLEPTYIYLVPTQGLIDAERRAFFVQQSGPRPFTNVEIAVLDNKSGAIHVEKYPEVGARSQNRFSPRYFWIKPSVPWDEDYTVTITSSNNPPVTQRMIVRSTHHILQFAVEVAISDKPTPVLICRDAWLPKSYSLGNGAPRPCQEFMTVPQELENTMQPSPQSIALPDGSFKILKIRSFPNPSELEANSETRRLSDFQRARINAAVTRFRGAKLLILSTSGKETWRYAKEFRDVFQSSGWKVLGPRRVPPGEERIIDVQISLNVNAAPTNALAIKNALAQAGIKHRQYQVKDPDIQLDLTVLWIGPQSPSGITPDDCRAPVLNPPKDGAQPCDFVAQVPKIVPIVPE